MNLRDCRKLAEALRLTLGCMPGVMVGLGSGSGTEALPKLPGAFPISRFKLMKLFAASGRKSLKVVQQIALCICGRIHPRKAALTGC